MVPEVHDACMYTYISGHGNGNTTPLNDRNEQLLSYLVSKHSDGHWIKHRNIHMHEQLAPIYIRSQPHCIHGHGPGGAHMLRSTVTGRRPDDYDGRQPYTQPACSLWPLQKCTIHGLGRMPRQNTPFVRGSPAGS